MPKEKLLYVCDEKHDSKDVALELEETVPYPENMQYGEKDSIHYYYVCPLCSKTYLAYKKLDKPLEWIPIEKDVWKKRITNVREARVNILKKGLAEQKTEIERVHSETTRQLEEIDKKKSNLLREIEKKNMLLNQLNQDEEELQKKIDKESEELDMINRKIESLTMAQPLL